MSDGSSCEDTTLKVPGDILISYSKVKKESCERSIPPALLNVFPAALQNGFDLHPFSNSIEVASFSQTPNKASSGCQTADAQEHSLPSTTGSTPSANKSFLSTSSEAFSSLPPSSVLTSAPPVKASKITCMEKMEVHPSGIFRLSIPMLFSAQTLLCVSCRSRCTEGERREEPEIDESIWLNHSVPWKHCAKVSSISVKSLAHADVEQPNVVFPVRPPFHSQLNENEEDVKGSVMNREKYGLKKTMSDFVLKGEMQWSSLEEKMNVVDGEVEGIREKENFSHFPKNTLHFSSTISQEQSKEKEGDGADKLWGVSSSLSPSVDVPGVYHAGENNDDDGGNERKHSKIEIGGKKKNKTPVEKRFLAEDDEEVTESEDEVENRAVEPLECDGKSTTSATSFYTHPVPLSCLHYFLESVRESNRCRIFPAGTVMSLKEALGLEKRKCTKEEEEERRGYRFPRVSPLGKNDSGPTDVEEGEEGSEDRCPSWHYASSCSTSFPFSWSSLVFQHAATAAAMNGAALSFRNSASGTTENMSNIYHTGGREGSGNNNTSNLVDTLVNGYSDPLFIPFHSTAVLHPMQKWLPLRTSKNPASTLSYSSLSSSSFPSLPLLSSPFTPPPSPVLLSTSSPSSSSSSYIAFESSIKKWLWEKKIIGGGTKHLSFPSLLHEGKEGQMPSICELEQKGGTTPSFLQVLLSLGHLLREDSLLPLPSHEKEAGKEENEDGKEEVSHVPSEEKSEMGRVQTREKLSTGERVAQTTTATGAERVEEWINRVIAGILPMINAPCHQHFFPSCKEVKKPKAKTKTVRQFTPPAVPHCPPLPKQDTTQETTVLKSVLHSLGLPPLPPFCMTPSFSTPSFFFSFLQWYQRDGGCAGMRNLLPADHVPVIVGVLRRYGSDYDWWRNGAASTSPPVSSSFEQYYEEKEEETIKISHTRSWSPITSSINMNNSNRNNNKGLYVRVIPANELSSSAFSLSPLSFFSRNGMMNDQAGRGGVGSGNTTTTTTNRNEKNKWNRRGKETEWNTEEEMERCLEEGKEKPKLEGVDSLPEGYVTVDSSKDDCSRLKRVKIGNEEREEVEIKESREGEEKAMLDDTIPVQKEDKWETEDSPHDHMSTGCADTFPPSSPSLLHPTDRAAFVLEVVGEDVFDAPIVPSEGMGENEEEVMYHNSNKSWRRRSPDAMKKRAAIDGFVFFPGTSYTLWSLLLPSCNFLHVAGSREEIERTAGYVSRILKEHEGDLERVESMGINENRKEKRSGAFSACDSPDSTAISTTTAPTGSLKPGLPGNEEDVPPSNDRSWPMENVPVIGEEEEGGDGGGRRRSGAPTMTRPIATSSLLPALCNSSSRTSHTNALPQEVLLPSETKNHKRSCSECVRIREKEENVRCGDALGMTEDGKESPQLWGPSPLSRFSFFFTVIISEKERRKNNTCVGKEGMQRHEGGVGGVGGTTEEEGRPPFPLSSPPTVILEEWICDSIIPMFVVKGGQINKNACGKEHGEGEGKQYVRKHRNRKATTALLCCRVQYLSPLFFITSSMESFNQEPEVVGSKITNTDDLHSPHHHHHHHQELTSIKYKERRGTGGRGSPQYYSQVWVSLRQLYFFSSSSIFSSSSSLVSTPFDEEEKEKNRRFTEEKNKKYLVLVPWSNSELIQYILLTQLFFKARVEAVDAEEEKEKGVMKMGGVGVPVEESSTGTPDAFSSDCTDSECLPPFFSSLYAFSSHSSIPRNHQTAEKAKKQEDSTIEMAELNAPSSGTRKESAGPDKERKREHEAKMVEEKNVHPSLKEYQHGRSHKTVRFFLPTSDSPLPSSSAEEVAGTSSVIPGEAPERKGMRWTDEEERKEEEEDDSDASGPGRQEKRERETSHLEVGKDLQEKIHHSSAFSLRGASTTRTWSAGQVTVMDAEGRPTTTLSSGEDDAIGSDSGGGNKKEEEIKRARKKVGEGESRKVDSPRGILKSEKQFQWWKQLRAAAPPVSIHPFSNLPVWCCLHAQVADAVLTIPTTRNDAAAAGTGFSPAAVGEERAIKCTFRDPSAKCDRTALPSVPHVEDSLSLYSLLPSPPSLLLHSPLFFPTLPISSYLYCGYAVGQGLAEEMALLLLLSWYTQRRKALHSLLLHPQALEKREELRGETREDPTELKKSRGAGAKKNNKKKKDVGKRTRENSKISFSSLSLPCLSKDLFTSPTAIPGNKKSRDSCLSSQVQKTNEVGEDYIFYSSPPLQEMADISAGIGNGAMLAALSPLLAANSSSQEWWTAPACPSTSSTTKSSKTSGTPSDTSIIPACSAAAGCTTMSYSQTSNVFQQFALLLWSQQLFLSLPSRLVIEVLQPASFALEAALQEEILRPRASVLNTALQNIIQHIFSPIFTRKLIKNASHHFFFSPYSYSPLHYRFFSSSNSLVPTTSASFTHSSRREYENKKQVTPVASLLFSSSSSSSSCFSSFNQTNTMVNVSRANDNSSAFHYAEYKDFDLQRATEEKGNGGKLEMDWKKYAQPLVLSSSSSSSSYHRKQVGRDKLFFSSNHMKSSTHNHSSAGSYHYCCSSLSDATVYSCSSRRGDHRESEGGKTCHEKERVSSSSRLPSSVLCTNTAHINVLSPVKLPSVWWFLNHLASWCRDVYFTVLPFSPFFSTCIQSFSVSPNLLMKRKRNLVDEDREIHLSSSSSLPSFCFPFSMSTGHPIGRKKKRNQIQAKQKDSPHFLKRIFDPHDSSAARGSVGASPSSFFDPPHARRRSRWRMAKHGRSWKYKKKFSCSCSSTRLRALASLQKNAVRNCSARHENRAEEGGEWEDEVEELQSEQVPPSSASFMSSLTSVKRKKKPADKQHKKEMKIGSYASSQTMVNEKSHANRTSETLSLPFLSDTIINWFFSSLLQVLHMAAKQYRKQSQIRPLQKKRRRGGGGGVLPRRGGRERALGVTTLPSFLKHSFVPVSTISSSESFTNSEKGEVKWRRLTRRPALEKSLENENDEEENEEGGKKMLREEVVNERKETNNSSVHPYVSSPVTSECSPLTTRQSLTPFTSVLDRVKEVQSVSASMKELKGSTIHRACFSSMKWGEVLKEDSPEVQRQYSAMDTPSASPSLIRAALLAKDTHMTTGTTTTTLNSTTRSSNGTCSTPASAGGDSSTNSRRDCSASSFAPHVFFPLRFLPSFPQEQCASLGKLYCRHSQSPPHHHSKALVDEDMCSGGHELDDQPDPSEGLQDERSNSSSGDGGGVGNSAADRVTFAQEDSHDPQSSFSPFETLFSSPLPSLSTLKDAHNSTKGREASCISLRLLLLALANACIQWHHSSSGIASPLSSSSFPAPTTTPCGPVEKMDSKTGGENRTLPGGSAVHNFSPLKLTGATSFSLEPKRTVMENENEKADTEEKETSIRANKEDKIKQGEKEEKERDSKEEDYGGPTLTLPYDDKCEDEQNVDSSNDEWPRIERLAGVPLVVGEGENVGRRTGCAAATVTPTPTATAVELASGSPLPLTPFLTVIASSYGSRFEESKQDASDEMPRSTENVLRKPCSQHLDLLSEQVYQLAVLALDVLQYSFRPTTVSDAYSMNQEKYVHHSPEEGWLRKYDETNCVLESSSPLLSRTSIPSTQDIRKKENRSKKYHEKGKERFAKRAHMGQNPFLRWSNGWKYQPVHPTVITRVTNSHAGSEVSISRYHGIPSSMGVGTCSLRAVSKNMRKWRKKKTAKQNNHQNQNHDPVVNTPDILSHLVSSPCNGKTVNPLSSVWYEPTSVMPSTPIHERIRKNQIYKKGEQRGAEMCSCSIPFYLSQSSCGSFRHEPALGSESQDSLNPFSSQHYNPLQLCLCGLHRQGSPHQYFGSFGTCSELISINNSIPKGRMKSLSAEQAPSPPMPLPQWPNEEKNLAPPHYCVGNTRWSTLPQKVSTLREIKKREERGTHLPPGTIPAVTNIPATTICSSGSDRSRSTMSSSIRTVPSTGLFPLLPHDQVTPSSLPAVAAGDTLPNTEKERPLRKEDVCLLQSTNNSTRGRAASPSSPDPHLSVERNISPPLRAASANMEENAFSLHSSTPLLFPPSSLTAYVAHQEECAKRQQEVKEVNLVRIILNTFPSTTTLFLKHLPHSRQRKQTETKLFILCASSSRCSHNESSKNTASGEEKRRIKEEGGNQPSSCKPHGTSWTSMLHHRNTQRHVIAYLWGLMYGVKRKGRITSEKKKLYQGRHHCILYDRERESRRLSVDPGGGKGDEKVLMRLCKVEGKSVYARQKKAAIIPTSSCYFFHHSTTLCSCIRSRKEHIPHSSGSTASRMGDTPSGIIVSHIYQHHHHARRLGNRRKAMGGKRKWKSVNSSATQRETSSRPTCHLPWPHSRPFHPYLAPQPTPPSSGKNDDAPYPVVDLLTAREDGAASVAASFGEWDKEKWKDHDASPTMTQVDQEMPESSASNDSHIQRQGHSPEQPCPWACVSQRLRGPNPLSPSHDGPADERKNKINISSRAEIRRKAAMHREEEEEEKEAENPRGGSEEDNKPSPDNTFISRTTPSAHPYYISSICKAPSLLPAPGSVTPPTTHWVTSRPSMLSRTSESIHNRHPSKVAILRRRSTPPILFTPGIGSSPFRFTSSKQGTATALGTHEVSKYGRLSSSFSPSFFLENEENSGMATILAMFSHMKQLSHSFIRSRKERNRIYRLWKRCRLCVLRQHRQVVHWRLLLHMEKSCHAATFRLWKQQVEQLERQSEREIVKRKAAEAALEVFLREQQQEKLQDGHEEKERESEKKGRAGCNHYLSHYSSPHPSDHLIVLPLNAGSTEPSFTTAKHRAFTPATALSTASPSCSSYSGAQVPRLPSSPLVNPPFPLHTLQPPVSLCHDMEPPVHPLISSGIGEPTHCDPTPSEALQKKLAHHSSVIPLSSTGIAPEETCISEKEETAFLVQLAATNHFPPEASLEIGKEENEPQCRPVDLHDSSWNLDATGLVPSVQTTMPPEQEQKALIKDEELQITLSDVYSTEPHKWEKKNEVREPEDEEVATKESELHMRECKTHEKDTDIERLFAERKEREDKVQTQECKIQKSEKDTHKQKLTNAQEIYPSIENQPHRYCSKAPFPKDKEIKVPNGVLTEKHHVTVITAEKPVLSMKEHYAQVSNFEIQTNKNKVLDTQSEATVPEDAFLEQLPKPFCRLPTTEKEQLNLVNSEQTIPPKLYNPPKKYSNQYEAPSIIHHTDSYSTRTPFEISKSMPPLNQQHENILRLENQHTPEVTKITHTDPNINQQQPDIQLLACQLRNILTDAQHKTLPLPVVHLTTIMKASQLLEKESAIRLLEEEIRAKETELEHKTANVVAKETELEHKTSNVVAKESAAAMRESELLEKESAIRLLEVGGEEGNEKSCGASGCSVVFDYNSGSVPEGVMEVAGGGAGTSGEVTERYTESVKACCGHQADDGWGQTDSDIQEEVQRASVLKMRNWRSLFIGDRGCRRVGREEDSVVEGFIDGASFRFCDGVGTGVSVTDVCNRVDGKWTKGEKFMFCDGASSVNARWEEIRRMRLDMQSSHIENNGLSSGQAAFAPEYKNITIEQRGRDVSPRKEAVNVSDVLPYDCNSEGFVKDDETRKEERRVKINKERSCRRRSGKGEPKEQRKGRKDKCHWMVVDDALRLEPEVTFLKAQRDELQWKLQKGFSRQDHERKIDSAESAAGCFPSLAQKLASEIPGKGDSKECSPPLTGFREKKRGTENPLNDYRCKRNSMPSTPRAGLFLPLYCSSAQHQRLSDINRGGHPHDVCMSNSCQESTLIWNSKHCKEHQQQESEEKERSSSSTKKNLKSARFQHFRGGREELARNLASHIHRSDAYSPSTAEPDVPDNSNSSVAPPSHHHASLTEFSPVANGNHGPPLHSMALATHYSRGGPPTLIESHPAFPTNAGQSSRNAPLDHEVHSIFKSNEAIPLPFLISPSTSLNVRGPIYQREEINSTSMTQSLHYRVLEEYMKKYEDITNTRGTYRSSP